jgi:DNA replication protein DnaC
MGSRYGAAVQSRIEGEYELLPFTGEDIRKLKRQRG